MHEERLRVVAQVWIFDADFLCRFGFRRLFFIRRFVGSGDVRFFNAVNDRLFTNAGVVADVGEIEIAFAVRRFESSDVFPIVIFRRFDFESPDLFARFVKSENECAVARIVVRPKDVRLAF